MKENKYAQKLKRLDNQAYIRRCMWNDLDERISQRFASFKARSAPVFGETYLSFLKERPKYKNSPLLAHQFHNATYIKFGSRRLGIANIPDESQSSLVLRTEHNAQLFYTQGSIGDVLVVLSPYVSEVYKVEESEIVIARYKQPSDISSKDIEKHLRVFEKYALATSHSSAGLFRPYVYRRWIQYQDFRYKDNNRKHIVLASERILLFVLAAAGVWLAA